MKTFLITGATGLIGQHLLGHYLQQGHQIWAWSRRVQHSLHHENLHWVRHLDQIQASHIDYVVNLAGASIGNQRWSKANKHIILESRLQITQQLYAYLQQRQLIPQSIVSASAIGYYGIDDSQHWAQNFSEDDLPQAIFASDLCQQWEQAALADPQQNTKIVRFGVVLSRQASALQKMLLPIKLNLFGKLGTGQQPFVWVHIDDVLEVVDFLLQQPQQAQVFNVVAPSQDRQQDFVQIASQILGKKPLLSLPAFLIKSVLGEQAQLVLNGQFVQPKALLSAGYQFKYAHLDQALANIL